MKIESVYIYSEDHTFKSGNVYVEDGRISKIEYVKDIPHSSNMLLPGFIDMHLHGCYGTDFCDATVEAIQTLTTWELRQGVTAVCPATMTLSKNDLLGVIRNCVNYMDAEHDKQCADLVGINMEGPFISKKKAGAQDDRFIVPCDVETAMEFIEAGEGLVRIMGLAPECGDYETYIPQMKENVVVSLCHTNADYDTAMRAIALGASHAVHLCNAMPAYHHRAPGVIGAVADNPNVTAEIICDGLHVHPSIVRSIIKMLGEERVIFISDSIRATGLSEGNFMLGGLEVEVRGHEARLRRDGSLAGSLTTLPDCMRFAIKKMQLPVEQVVRFATENPAKRLNIFKDRGSISVGKRADFVMWDWSMNTVAIYKDGEKVVIPQEKKEPLFKVKE